MNGIDVPASTPGMTHQRSVLFRIQTERLSKPAASDNLFLLSPSHLMPSRPLTRRTFTSLTLGALALPRNGDAEESLPATLQTDVFVYGATPCGIACAI